MGRLYVASVLMGISDTSAKKVAEVELKPMSPGAWAAWARDWDRRAELEPAKQTADTALAPSPLQPAGSKA